MSEDPLEEEYEEDEDGSTSGQGGGGLWGLAPYERLVYQDDEVYVIDHDGFQVAWYRDRPHQYSSMRWERPDTYFVVGSTKGVGKSNTLEFIADLYRKHGACVVDLNGSTDGEGLAWLRNPEVSKRRVLLVKSPDVELRRKPCDAIDYTDFDYYLVDDYDVVVNAAPLYTSMEEELHAARELFLKLAERRSWSRVAATVIRESQDLFTSRVYAYKGQKEVKGLAIYMVRESRHFGMATLLDTMKETSIDADLRYLSDYVIFKEVGLWGIPEKFRWIYSYIEPPRLATLPVNKCVIASKNTALGYGTIPYMKWHKQVNEDLLSLLGVEVELPSHNPELNEAVGELDVNTHARIVEDYAGGMSMKQISLKYEVSTATVSRHIQVHNRAIHEGGECPPCRHAESIYYDKEVTIRRK